MNMIKIDFLKFYYIFILIFRYDFDIEKLFSKNIYFIF